MQALHSQPDLVLLRTQVKFNARKASKFVLICFEEPMLVYGSVRRSLQFSGLYDISQKTPQAIDDVWIGHGLGNVSINGFQ